VLDVGVTVRLFMTMYFAMRHRGKTYNGCVKDALRREPHMGGYGDGQKFVGEKKRSPQLW